MRRVGELQSEPDAQTFHDALMARGIECTIEAEDGGANSIWVHDDDQITEAARRVAATVRRLRQPVEGPESGILMQ